MLRRCVWVLLVCAASLTLCGCGASPTSGNSPNPTPPSAANLAGNWLLAGTLPTGPAVPITRTQLSVTFATVGSQIVGGGRAWVVCPAPSSNGSLFPGAVGFGFVVSGQMTSNGDFVTQSQNLSLGGSPVPAVNISGHVPSAPGGTWTGSYVLDTRQAQSSCPVMVGDATSAASIAPLTGTYKATGTATSSTTKTPITVTVVLQQGVSATAADGTVTNQASALTGTMTVEGTPCFHTGSLRSVNSVGATGLAAIGAVVQGDAALPEFTMDDGSRLVMPLYVANTSASQLNPESFGVAGGSCATALTQQFQLGNFVRQP